MRKGIIAALLIGTVSFVQADPTRTYWTHENRLPEARQLEVGVVLDYQEEDISDSDKVWAVTPQFRYGLTRDLSLSVAVPVLQREPAVGDSVSGLGDVRVGLTLRAWEDIFGFPYLIPYVEAELPTGDEKKELGSEDGVVTAGIAIGTTVYDVLHYALDIGYRFEAEEENVVLIRGALIYDLSKKTSVLVEGEYRGKLDGEVEARKRVLAGFTYRPARNWIVGLYGGGQVTGDSDDVVGAMKVSYTFKPFIF
ncbi:MAG: transporter [Kiritimatiellia bacterium]|nr:transporter [Kiritimatiellia bacterium]